MNVDHALCALALWRVQVENEQLRLENAALRQELDKKPSEVKKNANKLHSVTADRS